MSATTQKVGETHEKTTVRKVIDAVQASGRTALTAPEAKLVCDAYGIPLPKEGLATASAAAAKLAGDIGFPVVMKIVSADILHKTDAGGVKVGIKSAEEAQKAFDEILENARRYKSDAKIDGVQVQQMLPAGATETIIGAITDPSFGKLIAFGLGGILVEVLKDITFRLAPVTRPDAFALLDAIKAKEILNGVRGGDPVSREALADIIVKFRRFWKISPKSTNSTSIPSSPPRMGPWPSTRAWFAISPLKHSGTGRTRPRSSPP